MTDSKLIFLLKTFKKSEWRRFREFLASPYFNKRTDLIAFFAYIASVAPDFSEKKLAKEIIYKKLYPKQDYDDKTMRYLMNYTLKAAEEFLGQQKMESKALRNNYILEELVDRELEKHSKRYFEKIAKNQDQVKERSSEFYYAKFRLADTANKQFNNQILRKDDANLAHAAANLDIFYFANKLKYSCEMLVRKKIFSTDYDLRFTNTIYEHLLSNEIVNEPLIDIYCQVYSTLAKEDASENFEVLKKLIRDHHDLLPDFEKKNIYLYTINYCMRQIEHNINRIYYANESLDLYLKGIKEEFLFSNGYLSPWTFKNVVKMGFNLKKYDWTEQFIQDYYTKLAPEFQEDALHYNLADLFYRKKNYQESQYHLQLVEYSDIFYGIDSKAMLLKIYYENEEIESLFSLIASFSIYLRRNKKISTNFRDTYLNFTMLLQQVVRATRGKIPKVIDNINSTELLTNRNWLLKICEDLK